MSVVAHGYLISIAPDFPGVLREYTVTPKEVLAQVKLEEEISSLLKTASFFLDTKSDDAGIELPVDFSREFERISLEKEFVTRLKPSV